MGIWQRTKAIFKSNINALLSKAEDPEKMLNQVLIDMKEQLVKAKKQVALAIADEKKLEKQMENEKQLAQEWERKAMLALQSGKEDLAREALKRKKEHESMALEYEKQWKIQAEMTEKLKIELNKLTDKIAEAERKKNLLIARQKRAEAQKLISQTMSGLSDTSAFDTFDRMAQKVEQIEAEAAATAELAGSMEDMTLEKQFKELEKASTVQDADYELIELKKKMGLLEPPKDEDTK